MEEKLLRFDPRQEIRSGSYEIQHKRDTELHHVELHHHDFYEIYYLISGKVTYQIEGIFQQVTPGDLLLISPQELHQVSIQAENRPYERLVLWLTPSEVRRLSTPNCNLEAGLNAAGESYTNLLHPQGDLNRVVRWCMETLYRETESRQTGSEILVESCLKQLLVIICRLQQGSRPETAGPHENAELPYRVLSYIADHYREKITLDTLAEQFFVSKYHLCHEFQKHIGTGIYQYLQKKRLQMAKQMLREGLSASATCAAAGFGDYAGFYRAFVSEYGLSPRAFFHTWSREDKDTLKKS